MSKQRYGVTVPVKECSGCQYWYIDADSPEQAILDLRNGGGEFCDEEVEVVSLDFEAAEAFPVNDDAK